MSRRFSIWTVFFVLIVVIALWTGSSRIGERQFLTNAQFDRIFADIDTASLVRPDATEARQKLGSEGLRRLSAPTTDGFGDRAPAVRHCPTPEMPVPIDAQTAASCP
jgi:hypothetical protein